MQTAHYVTYLRLLIVALLIIVGIAAFFIFQTTQKTADIGTLLSEKSGLITENNAILQQLSEANDTIIALTKELELTEEELADLKDDYRKEKRKNDDFEDQINAITGTVQDLDKLSKTDEELLQKYSKVYFLNENYIPSDIKQIDDDYILEGRAPQFFHGNALSFLEDMLDAAEDDGIDLKVLSAYRSFDAQTELKGAYTQTYGSGANAFSADQGYSEHQLGTTIDFTDSATGGSYTSFANTEAYQWLLRHADRYGFTLSYPNDNAFYVFEPWHWRFVGTELAEDLRDDKAHFYDWDQRKIDEYLLNIFD